MLYFFDFFTGIFIPYLLIFSGIFFFILSAKTIFSTKTIKSIFKKSEKSEKGVSSFSSFCLALSGTLGVGNITGIASAVYYGGAGTVFWLWVCAFISAFLKFAETVLALNYRYISSDGNYHGGAFTYIKTALDSPFLSVFFSVLCIFTSFSTGNMTQSKAAADALFVSFKFPEILTGLIFFIAVLFILVGKKEKIFGFVTKLIPPLFIFYTVISLCVIFKNTGNIQTVTRMILSEAFNPKSEFGGFSMYLFFRNMKYGIGRGIMSNEAGCGTSSIAYARSFNGNPIKQGFSAMAEVLCDTLFLCSLSAYVFLLSGAIYNGNSTAFALKSFSSVLGENIVLPLALSMTLFAFASVIAWGQYGKESLLFLKVKPRTIKLYGVIYSVFSFMGCIVSENYIWKLSDLSISAMAALNVICMLLLSSKFREILRNHRKSSVQM